MHPTSGNVDLPENIIGDWIGQAGMEKEAELFAENPELVLQREMRRRFDMDDLADRAANPMPVYPHGESAKFYRELFFAGFPCRVPHESSYKDVPGGAAAVSDFVTYSMNTIYSAFQSYGRITQFTYIRSRGYGCVVYDLGEDAISCFLSMNNAIIPGPVPNPNMKEPHEVDQVGFGGFERENRASNTTVKDYVITVEFARCLPFVTSYLLLKDEYASLELSRSLMRDFAVPENAVGGRLARWITAAWAEITVISPESNTPNEQKQQKEPPKKLTVFTGPMFNDSEQDQTNPVFQAMYALLKPKTFVKNPGSGLLLYELWWEYYNLYVIHKTEPSVDRIKSKREFLSATCATVAQEIIALKRDCWERGVRLENTSPNSLLRRVAFDDVFHCTLNSIIMKQKFKLDPAFTSFMRDVYSQRTVDAYKAYRALNPFCPDVDALRAMRQISKVLEQADRGNDECGKIMRRCLTEGDVAMKKKSSSKLATEAAASSSTAAPEPVDPVAELRADIEYSVHPKVQEWMSMPLLEVAANVVENVRFLRKVRKGLIGPDGMMQAAPNSSTEGDLGYPGMTVKQEDTDMFDEVLTNLNGFCEDGSLFSLLLLCESPTAFRGSKGHLGYEEIVEYHAKGKRNFWKDCKDVSKALAVPVVFVACFVMVVNYVTSRAPEEDMTVGTFWGKPEPRPRFETREDAARRHYNMKRAAAEKTRQPAATPVSGGQAGEGSTPVTTTGTDSEKEDLEALLKKVKEMDPEQLAKAREEATKKVKEAMQKAKEEAEKRGGTFNIGFSADL